MTRGEAYQERIADPTFRKAVEAIDTGDAELLRALLEASPELVTARVEFPEAGYFSNPSLLEFIAENPIRNDALPENICEIASIILDAGADKDQAILDNTLGLVSSGCVAREQGKQESLIRLLCSRGADPNSAMLTALVHGESGAVSALIEQGARVNLPVTAALRLPQFDSLLEGSSLEERRLAMTLAVMNGNDMAVVSLLMHDDIDPSDFNPPDAHSHSTPLHQAAYFGHLGCVKALVQAGASLESKDTAFHSTPEGWARHAGHQEIADYLHSAAQKES